MATIREDRLDAVIDLLMAYRVALTAPIENLDGDEAALIRKHRIEKARRPLENAGISVAPPLGEVAPLPPDDPVIDGSLVISVGKEAVK